MGCPVLSPLFCQVFCRQSFSRSRGSVGVSLLWETSRAKSVSLGRIPPSRGGNLVKRTKLAPSYRAPWKSPPSGPSIAAHRPFSWDPVGGSPRFFRRSTRPGWTGPWIDHVWCSVVAGGGRSAERNNASADRLRIVGGSPDGPQLCRSPAPRWPRSCRARGTSVVPWARKGVFRPSSGR